MNDTQSTEMTETTPMPEMSYQQKLDFLESLHQEIREQRGLPIGEDDFVPSENEDDDQQPANNKKYQEAFSIGSL
jgi:hypothetical protein